MDHPIIARCFHNVIEAPEVNSALSRLQVIIFYSEIVCQVDMTDPVCISAEGAFEIIFPRGFVYAMKALRRAPNALYFWILRTFIMKNRG